MIRTSPLRIIIITCVLVLSGFVVKSFFFPGQATTPQFLTTTVTLKNIEQTVIATGTLEAFKQVSVGAQASGQIKSLRVDFGDRVKKGDLIAEIDSMTQENTLEDARAKLANVEAQRQAKEATLKQADLAFQRQKKLLTQNAGSREDYENAEATLSVTKAEIAALNAQIEESKIQVSSAEVNLGYTRITAPLDGTVVAVVAKEGQTVNATQQTPTIVKLAQLDKMTIKAEISEADIVHVRPGQAVFFTILGQPDNRRHATLRAIEPAPTSINSDSSSDSISSTSSSTTTAIYYNGIFDVPNEDGILRISMTAQVSIILAEAKQVPVISVSALGLPNPDGTYTVSVLEKTGTISKRTVRIGIEDAINAQVLAGLEIGDDVILGDAAQGSTTRMRPGMRL